MLSEISKDTLDWTAIIVALFVAIPSTIAAVAALKNGRKADEARGVAEVAVTTAADAKTEILDAMDTTNDKKLGVYIHDIAQQLEFVIAQVHTNTTELMMLAEKVQAAEDRVEQHIEEVAPLKSYVQDKMNNDEPV